jgi:hypothetical protein
MPPSLSPPPVPSLRSRRALEWLARVVAASVVSAALVACPGTLDRSRFSGGAAPCDVPARFVTSCAGGTCHSPGSGLVDLVSPGLAERLVAPSSCMGAPLADPDDPEGGVLYAKLAGQQTCGSKMPIGQPAFTADELACVRSFVETLPPPMSTGGGGAGGRRGWRGWRGAVRRAPAGQGAAEPSVRS